MESSTLVHAASLSTCRITSGLPSAAATGSTGSTGSIAPAELSDAELITATRGLVGRSNQLLASLLAHLGEVEARGIHRARACASLYAYCIYELRFSEDEAFRRVTAARLVRRFPLLLDALASGELHLTGLLMLGPLLTAENCVEVLARAKHRTKKELARLVRVLDPLPQVPPRIEPLGPASSRLVPAAARWDQLMSALNPVRELEPGARPRDWTADAPPANSALARSDEDAPSANSALARSDEDAPPANSALARSDEDAPPANSALARVDTSATAIASQAQLEPQRYKVQFEASEEYVELVGKATALLAHSNARTDLGELHLRALRALVTELERKKYAATDRPRQLPGSGAPQLGSDPEPRSDLELEAAHGRGLAHGREHPRQRGRHVPAALRRTVFERDQGRCTYRSDSGEHCRETGRLEFHHLVPFARGGEHRLENLVLRCRAHNALAAEQDFGADLIQQGRDSNRHESFRRQTEQSRDLNEYRVR